MKQRKVLDLKEFAKKIEKIRTTGVTSFLLSTSIAASLVVDLMQKT